MNAKEALVDAFARVSLALATPSLTENEKMILEMVYLHGISVEDASKTLLMKQKEVRAYLYAAVDKATEPPKKLAALENCS